MEIKIWTLYSIRKHFKMQSKQLFLISTDRSFTQKSQPLLTVNFSNSNQTINCTAVMEGKSTLFFIIDGHTYIVNPKCKMQTIYNIQAPQSPLIDRIIFHSESSQMTLLSKDNCLLQKVYQQLKMILSHKGFNDYFRPLKRLGRGSFAAVYLIQHKITKEQFAAKVFSRQGQKIQYKGKEALQNEIRTLKLLSHPNIIQYEGIYETDNLIYLVTEYLSGGTLQTFMRNKSKLLGDFIAKIISDTLTALSYLQANNIMHRDIKPENIILREKDGMWVLADFGLAAFTNEVYLYDKCGTMGYIAPEILMESTLPKLYTSACDLYSLGVISYQLVTGSLPFKVQMENLFDRKVIWQAFKTPECIDLHPDIEMLLRGLLEQNPALRLTPAQALKSSFFTDSQVIQNWKTFNQKNLQATYDKILKVKNRNI